MGSKLEVEPREQALEQVPQKVPEESINREQWRVLREKDAGRAGACACALTRPDGGSAGAGNTGAAGCNIMRLSHCGIHRRTRLLRFLELQSIVAWPGEGCDRRD